MSIFLVETAEILKNKDFNNFEIKIAGAPIWESDKNTLKN